MALRKMLDLSTAHVPPVPTFGDCRHQGHDYGWIVFVGGGDLGGHEGEDAGGVPDWLRPIWTEACRRECMLINFDADGPTDKRFPTYEHT